MVYCNYISNTNESVTYAYGARCDDITGEVIFDFGKDTIEVVKTPKMEEAPKRHIKSLYGKYSSDFKKGIFKQKISYEI